MSQPATYPPWVTDLVRQMWGRHDCPADYKAVSELNESEVTLLRRWIKDLDDLPEDLQKRLYLK